MKLSPASVLLLLISLIGMASAADPLAGDYYARARGHDYEVSLRSDDGRVFEGFLRIDDRLRPLDARRFGERLVGRAGRAADAIGVVAELQGMGLLLQLDDDPPLFLRRR